MKRNTRLLFTLIGAAAISICSTAMASGPASFTSKTPLTAAEEVQNPAVVSDGRANAIIAFSRNFRVAIIRATFTNLEGEVTRFHMHCNVAGANGPIAIGFIDLIAPALDNSEVVKLDSNTIIGRISNFQFPPTDPCPGVVGQNVNNLRSLADAIDAGLIYWNLHTTAFPAGELRGQVQALSLNQADQDDD